MEGGEEHGEGEEDGTGGREGREERGWGQRHVRDARKVAKARESLEG